MKKSLFIFLSCCFTFCGSSSLFSQFEIKAGETGFGIVHVDLIPHDTLEAVSQMGHPNDPWARDSLLLDIKQDNQTDIRFDAQAAPYSPSYEYSNLSMGVLNGMEYRIAPDSTSSVPYANFQDSINQQGIWNSFGDEFCMWSFFDHGGGMCGVEDKYLPIRFDSAGTYHYGWVLVSMGLSGYNSSGKLTVKSFGWRRDAQVSAAEGLSQVKIKIGPNPGSSHFDIQIDSHAQGSATISVTDLWGRDCLKERQTAVPGEVHRLDASSWPPGFYFLRLTIGEETITRKLYRN